MPIMSARMHDQMTHALTHLAEATGQSKAFMAINALLGCLQHIKRKGPSRQQENAAKKRVCAEVSQTPETTKPANGGLCGVAIWRRRWDSNPYLRFPPVYPFPEAELPTYKVIKD